MKNSLSLLLSLLFVSLWNVSINAADLGDLASDLADETSRIADDAYDGFRDRTRGNREDVEALYRVVEFSAGATLFRRMVDDRRPRSELQDAVSFLQREMGTLQRYTFVRRSWNRVRRDLDEISRRLGAYYGDRDRNDRGRDYRDRNDFAPRVTGRMQWRGRVDDRIQIRIQGSNAANKLISGGPVRNESARFTSPLPRRDVRVEVKKLKGRGDVEVVQQPAPYNGYTAVVEIFDPKGGAADYEFELYW